MTEPSLVVCGPDECGELLTLQRAAYAVQAQIYAEPFLPPLTETLDEVAAVLADPATTTLGLRVGHRLVGAVRVRRTGDTAHLGRLVVAPDLQCNGHGTRLLLAAEEAAGGAARMLLFTGHRSDDNLRLYRRHGYVETHRETVDDKVTLVHFAKPLDRPGGASGPVAQPA